MAKATTRNQINTVELRSFNADGTENLDSAGNSVVNVQALPTQQVAIVQSDSTVIDLMGLRCHVAGAVAIKLTNDSAAVTWTVIAGEIIYGRIVAVMATDTTLVNGQMTGLK